MADQEFDFKHLGNDLDYFTGPGLPSWFNNHQLPPGLSAFNGWFIKALSTVTRRMVLSNDAAVFINAPLRMSLVQSATPISNTTTDMPFNKTLVLPTGCLTAIGATEGTVLRVVAGGPISTKTPSPGGISIAIHASDGTNFSVLANMFVSELPWGQSNLRWSLVGSMTVRASSVAPAAESYIVPLLSTGEVVVTSSGTSFNTNLAPVVSVRVQWVTGDVANTIGLDKLVARVEHPGGIAS